MGVPAILAERDVAVLVVTVEVAVISLRDYVSSSYTYVVSSV